MMLGIPGDALVAWVALPLLLAHLYQLIFGNDAGLIYHDLNLHKDSLARRSVKLGADNLPLLAVLLLIGRRECRLNGLNDLPTRNTPLTLKLVQYRRDGL